MKIQERILEIVNAKQGVKGTELSARLAVEFLNYSLFELDNVLEEMIEQGELIRIEYELENDCKSFLLPRGTPVHIDKVKMK